MSSSHKPEDGCVVCCRKSSIYAVGPCDHRVCFVCSSRMRVLCLKNECPICRQDMPKVIFTKTEHPYSVIEKMNYRTDHKYKISFADDETEDAYYSLLENTCDVCSNKPKFNSFGHLKDHLRKQHERFFCELCVENLKLFTFERRHYNRKDLAHHRRLGDVDDTSHKGHPLCQYCSQRYIDKDDLYRHLRKDHYYCHFCDADGITTCFYADYNLLYLHFQEEHFVCEEGTCREDKYTGVFKSDIDLIAHKAAHHSKNLTKQQAKQARTLELNFSIAPRYSQHNGSTVTGEYDRFNKRGGNKGPKNPHRDTHNDKESRVEMSIGPDWLSPVLEPESHINMQCEREFPHLSITGNPRNVASENQKFVKSNKNFRAKKWNNPTSSYEDNYPSLSTTITPSASGNTFMVQLNRDGVTSGQHGPNISIQVSNNLKGADQVNNFGVKSIVTTPQTTLTVSRTPTKSTTAKSSFDQNFPRLGNEDTMRTTIYVPLWKKSDEQNKSQKQPSKKSAEFTVVKGKNEKKAEKSASAEMQSKQKTTRDNGNKKKKKELIEEFPSANGMSFGNHTTRLETRLNNLPKKSDELLQKTQNLVMDDFPALESVHKSNSIAPPGFKSSLKQKDSQPPPGFTAPKQSISISLSSVAEELTKPNSNNNIIGSLTNNSPPFAANTSYTEPQDFQLRNQSLIEEIRNLLQNNIPLFDMFRTLSREFRQSQISATKYYDECIEMFGKESFNKILPELLVLLPDITKQQELLCILNKLKRKDAEGGGAVPKNGAWNIVNMQFMVCATCQQVLCSKDFRDHMASHNDDFPSLIQPNRTTAQISWVKK